MTPLIPRLAVVFLCLLFSRTAAQEETFQAAIDRAQKSFHAGKLDDALTQFARARALNDRRWEGHAGQALTLLQQALKEHGARRVALTRAAEAMTTALVKKSGLMFQHPLRNYILGLCASLRGELKRAVDILKKAHSAPAKMFLPFESMQLRRNVSQAYGRALMDFGKQLIIERRLKAAHPLLERAQHVLPKGDTGWAELERSLAVLDAAFNRWQSAIKRLYKCAEMAGEDTAMRLEFYGTIALIYLKNEKHAEGVKVLAGIAEDSKHPRILSARCTALMIPALRAGSNDPRVDKTLAYFRKAMKDCPKAELYGLVEDYTKIVLHKVGIREAKQERGLLEDTVLRMLVEVKRRPECPTLYFLLYRVYRLLGNTSKATEFSALHTRKRAEFKLKAQFDSRGRRRCQ